MTGKEELTPRQVRERAAYEAERVEEVYIEGTPVVGTNVVVTATSEETPPRVSTRDYLRKKAGWPPLKGR